MKSILPAPDFDELFDFTPLHKAALHLEGYELDSALTAVDLNVDVTDKDGRTPLSWAIDSNNIEVAQEFLTQGADCNSKDNTGFFPLWHAVMKSEESTKLLLAAGANLHTKIPHYNVNVLNGAILSLLPEDHAFRIAEVLIEAGIDINLMDACGTTPLLLSTFKKRTELVRCLLSHNANMEHCNVDGYNALTIAIRENCHSILKLLLSKHMDHIGRLKHEGSLMHLVAMSADLRTLLLLKEGQLEPRDISVKNETGLTPMATAQARRDVDEEWRQAFADFLESIDEKKIRERRIISESEVAMLAAHGLSAPDDYGNDDCRGGDLEAVVDIYEEENWEGGLCTW